MLALAGCGGGHRADGRLVFRHSCSGCHTVSGHNTPAPGGDLAMTKLDIADITSFVRVMPVHLSPDKIRAVAAYVHAVEAKKAR